MATSTVYDEASIVTTLRASGKYFLMPIFMSQPINFLRLYRKRSPLTQADIAFLLALPDDSNISRYEKGQREPSIDLLIVYHLLFVTSIESFFEQRCGIIQLDLIKRVELLILDLKGQEDNPKNTYRITFLEEVVKRLTN